MRHPPIRRSVQMFDSVSVPEIPQDAIAVAGYVDGQWETFPGLLARFPHARHLSIAVSAAHDADCLDVEKGDATIAEAAAWVRRQWARGVKRPVLYTSVSEWRELQQTLHAAGVHHRPWGKSYRRWSAHYTCRPHRCGRRCGMPGPGRAGATQWTDRALGRNLDESLCAMSFLRRLR